MSVHNRNGRYAAFRATGRKKLKVWISITPETQPANGKIRRKDGIVH